MDATTLSSTIAFASKETFKQNKLISHAFGIGKSALKLADQKVAVLTPVIFWRDCWESVNDFPDAVKGLLTFTATLLGGNSANDSRRSIFINGIGSALIYLCDLHGAIHFLAKAADKLGKADFLKEHNVRDLTKSVKHYILPIKLVALSIKTYQAWNSYSHQKWNSSKGKLENLQGRNDLWVLLTNGTALIAVGLGLLGRNPRVAQAADLASRVFNHTTKLS